MPAIVSRDQVTVSGQTALVQIQKTDANGNVQGTAEQIYAYESGSVGTTEKTSTQNTTISSTLGVKVLDAADNAGEKAYTEVQQAAEKFEVAKEATEEQIKSSDTTYVCYINGYPYETLTAALTAATDGQTVTLLADSAESDLNVIGKSVTLDLGDYDLTNASGNTINKWSSGTLTIKGSENSVINGTVRAYATKVIFDSSFEGKVEKIQYEAPSALSIEGGNFKKIIYSAYSTETDYSPNKTIPDAYAYLSKWLTYEIVDEYYHIVPVTAENACASVFVNGTTYYFDTFDKAASYAKNGGTITFMQNYFGSINTLVNYEAVGDVILDLNGHTWDIKNGNTSPTTGIRLSSGNLTVKNGTIIPSGNSCNVFEVNGGTLTIESGNYYNADRGGRTIAGSSGGSCKGTLVIKGGIFGSISCDSACPSVTITGGTFNETIYLDNNCTSTNVNIYDGTFNGQLKTSTVGIGTFNIFGGTFNCYLGNAGTFNISGGTFNAYENMASTYGSILSKNSNSTFTVTGGTFGEDITTNTRVTISPEYHWDSTTKSVVADN